MSKLIAPLIKILYLPSTSDCKDEIFSCMQTTTELLCLYKPRGASHKPAVCNATAICDQETMRVHLAMVLLDGKDGFLLSTDWPETSITESVWPIKDIVTTVF